MTSDASLLDLAGGSLHEGPDALKYSPTSDLSNRSKGFSDVAETTVSCTLFL